MDDFLKPKKKKKIPSRKQAVEALRDKKIKALLDKAQEEDAEEEAPNGTREEEA